MERHVLIISPRFPPINSPEHHRVRIVLPYLHKLGWRPTVVTVRPDRVDGMEDPLLGSSVPREVEVVQTQAVPVKGTRTLGFGGLSYRMWPFFRRTVAKLLQERSFDLLFFSTTECLTFSCGPTWRKRYRVPYILDFQDPWRSDYFVNRSDQARPGGRLKYGLTQWLAKRLEPRAVRDAAHVISVSPDYPTMLRQRYPSLPADRFTVLPFAAASSDVEFMYRSRVRQHIFDPHDGNLHWVYVGRGGDDMAFSLRALFAAVKRLQAQDERQVRNWRFHFIGTDYASGNRARKTVEHVARAFHLEDIVKEFPHRIPYFEAMRCLSDAHYLLLLGSDDASYTASKIYPYILAQKPMFGVFHQNSSVVNIIRETNSGTLVTFQTGQTFEDVATTINQQWFSFWPPPFPKTNWTAFQPYTAWSMTEKMCEVFDRSIGEANVTD